jgi:hypothetical protein
MELLYTVFGLVMGFIRQLKFVTTISIYTVYKLLWHALSLISRLCLQQSSDSGYQWRAFLFFWVSEMSLSFSHSNFQPIKLQQLRSHVKLNLYTPFKMAVFTNQTEATNSKLYLNCCPNQYFQREISLRGPQENTVQRPLLLYDRLLD